MSKIYRSAKGRPVDMEALRRANEEKVAAGNMKVNARGDELGEGGAVVRNIADRARAAKGSPKQTVRTSLKPKVQEPKKEEGTVKTREDGSSYREVFDEEGNIETEELTPAKKKTTRKKVAKDETESVEDEGTSDGDGEGGA